MKLSISSTLSGRKQFLLVLFRKLFLSTSHIQTIQITSSTFGIIIIRVLVHNIMKDSICVKQVLFCYYQLRTSVGDNTTVELTQSIIEIICAHDFFNSRFAEIKDFQSRIILLVLHQHICKGQCLLYLTCLNHS